ncbi:MAG: hypothetical protein MJZ75_06475 [Paludibacteraceae bacterium]|nr:hypothetical protein [Paludibacteraceae bacterium]
MTEALANISPDFDLLYQTELTKFLSSKKWEKIFVRFLTTMKLQVASGDTDELKKFLRTQHEKCLSDFGKTELFYIFNTCYDKSTNEIDVRKFLKKVCIVNDGTLDSTELEAFFSYHCLTMSIDKLLQQVLEWESRQRNASILAENIVVVNGEILIQTKRPKAHEEETVAEGLENIIFNSHLFDTDEKLTCLRNIIVASINLGDDNGKLIAPEKQQITPSVQSEWYYILKAIDEAEIVSRRLFKDSTFTRQMISWYPWLFQFDSAEEMSLFQRKWQKSISHERSIWKKGKNGTITDIKDMWANYKNLNIDRAKVERLYAIANNLKHKLSDYKTELFRQKE